MSEFLFPESLISKELQHSLPSGFRLRPLSLSDYEKGFIATLSQLTTVGSLSRTAFLERYASMKAVASHYYVIVIEDMATKNIAAAGTILVEHKFVHQNGLVGHIEDIIVNEQYRGKNFGKWIIDQLKYIGDQVGCYKIILDCSQKNIPFYEKCGFSHKEYEMVLYLDHNDAAKKNTSKL